MRGVSRDVPVVSASRCTGCGLCGAVCPNGCLDLKHGTAALIRPEACAGEAACVSICPAEAIRMRKAPVRQPRQPAVIFGRSRSSRARR